MKLSTPGWDTWQLPTRPQESRLLSPHPVLGLPHLSCCATQRLGPAAEPASPLCASAQLPSCLESLQCPKQKRDLQSRKHFVIKSAYIMVDEGVPGVPYVLLLSFLPVSYLLHVPKSHHLPARKRNVLKVCISCKVKAPTDFVLLLCLLRDKFYRSTLG